MHNFILTVHLFKIFANPPNSEYSYLGIKFMATIQNQGSLPLLFKKMYPTTFLNQQNPIYAQLMINDFKHLTNWCFEDDCFRVRATFLTNHRQWNKRQVALGRVEWHELYNGTSKLRFQYDGQMLVSDLKLPGNGKKLIRDGFGRFCDYNNFFINVGWWTEDLPFGKMVIFGLQDQKNIRVRRQGYFMGTWDNYEEEPMLKNNTSSFADNLQGAHMKLMPCNKALINKMSEDMAA